MNDLKFTSAGDFLKSQQRRIGFACKYLHPDQTQKKKILEELQRPLTEKCTTVAWLNRQSRDDAEQRLWDIMEHNAAAAKRLVEYVGSLPEHLRMVRLGSNQLPCATESSWRYFWSKPDVVAYCEKHYAKVGEAARALDVRLSMHPGQFTVLASDNEEIVERSIEEFEYHATLIRYMGYGQEVPRLQEQRPHLGSKRSSRHQSSPPKTLARSKKYYHNRERRKQMGSRSKPRTC